MTITYVSSGSFPIEEVANGVGGITWIQPISGKGKTLNLSITLEDRRDRNSNHVCIYSHLGFDLDLGLHGTYTMTYPSLKAADGETKDYSLGVGARNLFEGLIITILIHGFERGEAVKGSIKVAFIDG